jgi:SAM-dependent methyltransferase
MEDEMTAEPVSRVGDDYVLPTGSDDRSRLDLIHAVYGPVSVSALEAGRIGACARVADVGCGTGTIARWMAERIGAAGRVDAVDVAADQVELARSTPSPAGAGAIEYHVASAYELPLPTGEFDLVFCRLVLCHLQDPASAVAEMTRLLKDGGRLVLVDFDMRSIRAMPPSSHYESIVHEVIPAIQAKLGVDYSIGTRLHELMLAAGLQTASVTTDQPVFGSAPQKFLWESTWAVAFPNAVASGFLDQAASDRLLAGAARDTASDDVWVAQAQMFAVVGQKPV